MCYKMMVGDSKVLEEQKEYNYYFHYCVSGNATTASQFGAATTTFMYTRIAGGCIGNESYLFNCPAYPVAVTCTTANPAAVICSSPCKGICLMLFHCITDV